MKKNSYNFKSEVKEVLNLMINSLYSNKEIFIRELISNASDAIDKFKFLSLSNPNTYNIDNDLLQIKIIIDKKNKLLKIIDNGIGMNKKDLIENLGTIAKSGTKKFLQSLNEKEKTNNNLIGNFGVGFYSSFIVSEKVSVYTKLANEKKNKGFLWESNGTGEYYITQIKKKTRGTKVVLHLKDKESIFLEKWNIENIINKYSDHISIPIKIKKKDKLNNKYIWKQINKAKSIWTLDKKNITKEKYIEFYKYLSKDNNDPLLWTHNKVEGNYEYINLLYIPSKLPWDLWNKEHKHGLKLYVKRVYIMDDAEQFLPNYLRFIKGIIDSNDLPLNVSREILQNNEITKTLKKSITKKILNMLLKLSINDNKKYNIFWKQFGLIMKESPAEDFDNKDLILKLLRFSSIKTKSKKQTLSLEEYFKNIQPNQEKIYFITSDNYITASNSPHLEIFKKNNIDVLLLYDRIDEWMMSYLHDFKGIPFQSINKIDDSINKMVSQKKSNIENKQEIDMFIKKVKEILKDKVKNVTISNYLTKTPVIVRTDSKDMSTQMIKLFSAAGQKVPDIKYIFEINPNHSLIKKLQNIKDEKKVENYIKILLDEALLIEKGTLENVHEFSERLNNILEEKI
ncbi:molecular chaperone HtpG [Buchnera aphidicola (Taiwanaphis decaspermi)]|uniref:molecular chaperone HtpG n=1 Tax=Buchnera aphidicola TaxID=9 RepID=UPI0031B89DD2